MGKVRVCGGRCHGAKGSKCLCWCGGAFHGSQGSDNRTALLQAATDEDKLRVLMEHGFIKGQAAYKDQTKLPLQVEAKQVSEKPVEFPEGVMTLLPPRPDLCQECAVKHDPGQPHNQQSLYYGVKFKIQNGRDPTWKDAMAHCTPEIQNRWIEELGKMGVKVE